MGYRHTAIVASAAFGLLAIGLAAPAGATATSAGGTNTRSHMVPLASRPASTAVAAKTSDPNHLTVTLQLADSNPAAVAALTTTRGLTGSQRRTRLDAVGPSAASRAQVVAAARAMGLTVTDQNQFAVTVSGQTARVNTLFGTSPAMPPGGQRRMSTAGGAVVPATLRGLVKFAISSAQTVPLQRPMLTASAGTQQPAMLSPLPGEVNGAIARTLYGAPASTGVIGPRQLTIATLQFSGWDPSALSTFVATQVPGLSDPVISGQYTGIGIAGANPSLPDATGGDIEVALDQESLIATAPNAAQRAYVAPNDGLLSTYLTALNTVASDAGTVSPPITALSISWGQCETNYSANELTAIDSAFASLTAAGVTVFAASGDSGAFDCGGSLGVDYPASSPYVVGVGGLTTDPTNPTAPIESVWWHNSSGGGGGVSVMEAQPAWQTSTAPSAHRLVPDISLTADPNQGFFTIYTTDTAQCALPSGCLVGVGGTSLASPLAAATLADLQMSLGAATSGQLGVIQPYLYDAQSTDLRLDVASGSRSFRDILSGTNGSYSAGIGYDKASGLGAPNWTNLANWLYLGIDVVAPKYATTREVPITATAIRSVSVSGAYSVGFSAGGGSAPAACPAPTSVSAPITATAGQDGLQPIWVRYRERNGSCLGGYAMTFVDTAKPNAHSTAAVTAPTSNTVNFRWSASDGAGSGVASYNVSITRLGAGLVKTLTSTTATSAAMNLVRGSTYISAVTAIDRAGNRSTTSTARVSVPLSVAWFRFSAGWVTSTNLGSVALESVSSATRTATASLTFTAKQYRLLITTCNSCGRAAIYLDGKYKTTISTYSTTTKNLVVGYAVNFAKAGRHTITVKVLRTKVYASHGYGVILDGLTAIN
ncbi:MAG: S53 family peptidase [Actinomycetes bacterium]